MTSLTEQALDFSVKTASPSVKRMRMDSGSSTETTPACVSPQRTEQLNAQTTSTLAALGALMQQGNHHNNSSALLSQFMLNPGLFLLGNSSNFSPTPTPQPLSSLSADLAAAQLLTSLGSTGGSSTTSSVGSVGSGPAAAVGSDPNVTTMALTALQRRRRRAAQKGAATVDGGDLLSSTQSTPNKDPDGRESTGVTPHKQRPMSATEDGGKDDTYWERRRKNNEAAKRSRDARRQKEEEVAARAAFLEQENLKLRAQVTILKNETAKLQLMLFSNVAQKHKQQQQQQQDTMQTAADSSLSPPLSTDEQQIVKHDCAF